MRHALSVAGKSEGVPTSSDSSRALRDRRLWAAIGLTVLYHGGLLVAGSFRGTYDAYVHIFFGDHYARDWFSTWEPRWYTGFTTTSYPPGTHQTIAVLSKFVGLEWGFAIAQLFALVVLVIGVYRFSRIWVGADAAGWAAILAVVSSSINEAVHTFGQLPTTFSLGFLLNAAPFAHRWIVRGAPKDLVLGVACTAATTAGHHVTTLFGSVFFVGPIIAHALLLRFREPLADERDEHPQRIDRSVAVALVARRVRRILPSFLRAGVYGGLVVCSLLVVVLPYWLWSSSDPITQIPIPHASRFSFIEDVNAGLVFWAVPWGAMLLLLPLALARGFASRAWPLAASISLLTLLGTGGTTPIPRMLLGGAFDILTLDRFTFWATIAVLPLAGRVVASLHDGRLAERIREGAHAVVLAVCQVALAVAFIAMAVFAADLSSFRPFQPDPIDPDPIVAFIEKDQHDRWRFLTLGFGDQMAWLSANTEATTVDGNYHSARRLPELTSTPVERLEGAKYRGVPGIGSLQQFLAVPSKYNLKFVFSNDRFYDPLLSFSGWHRLDTLSNGIEVWEREDIPPLPPELPSKEAPDWQRAMWGTVPPTAIVGALTLSLLRAMGLLRLPRRLQSPAGRLGDRLRDSWPARRWARIDARLAAVAARVETGGPAPRWNPLARIRTAISDRASRVTLPVPVIVAAMLAPIVSIGVLVTGDEGAGDGPDDAVVAFYDDIDFGRLSSAHARLDPETRPSLDLYLLQRSVSDGIVASYGKLDRIETTIVEQTDGTAVVRTELAYITSLQSYERTVDHDLVRRDGRWYLVPDAVDATVPPDQFVRRSTVDFLSQGRRQVTEGTTAYADILDRPEVVTADARAVRMDGRWVIVGEVVNTDADPADVTITGQLIDADGAIVAQYDAAQITVHKLLPKERAPFRIEFEGIAGALDVLDPTAGDFSPEAVTDLAIDDDTVASFAVYTSAVVTGRQTARPLQLQDARLVDDGDGTRLEGVLRNDGTAEVTIPHLLVTRRDADGRVVWVDHAYGEQSVRAQRSVPVALTLDDLTGLEVVELAGETYDNGLTDLADVTAPAPPLFETRHPVAPLVDVTVSGFERVPS